MKSEGRKSPHSRSDMAKKITSKSDPSDIKPKKRAPRGTFDRKAYMREYMRKRRAPIETRITITIGGVSA